MTKIREETGQNERKVTRRKKPKAPNPLSVKKKKKSDVGKVTKKETESAPTRKRTRKKKLKIASHAAASVNEKLKILMQE